MASRAYGVKNYVVRSEYQTLMIRLRIHMQTGRIDLFVNTILADYARLRLCSSVYALIIYLKKNTQTHELFCNSGMFREIFSKLPTAGFSRPIIVIAVCK